MPPPPGWIEGALVLGSLTKSAPEPVSLVQACLDLRITSGEGDDAEIAISSSHAAAALASALACFSAARVRELAALSPAFLAEADDA